MIRMYRAIAMVAACTLALAVGGTPMALAATVTTANAAVSNDAKARVGDRWQEVMRTGEVATMERVADGVTKSVTALPLSPQQCPGHPYFCLWSGEGFTGTIWRYNLNNVYANTANGVAHCWNLAADANNVTKSYYNASNDRVANVFNWVNCNTSGEFLGFLYGEWNTCGSFPGWCTTFKPTSIYAHA
jgi:hypothetical protein